MKRPPVTWSPVGSGANFTPVVNRKITTIVIHATEGGSLIGNVSWLTNDKAEASSHYVIDRDGTIVQVVPLHDIAWHSGNRTVNDHSVGIEHLGDTYDPTGFTPAEYRSSAQLVAWLVRRYDIPVDRQHIIGHSQVPDPFHPGLFGGSDHHTDPGPYWKWGYYLKLVKKFAFPNTIEVSTTSLEQGETVRGIVPWHISLKGGAASKVDFLVDGKELWSDSIAPFGFAGGRGLNTTTLSNGPHVLTVRATGKDGSSSQRTIIEVANHVFAITTSAIHPWQVLKGVVRVRANAWGASSTGIGLYVDHKIVSRDRKAPYTLWWNTRRVEDGAHALALVAESADGRVARRSLTVVVRNAKPRAAAAPPAPAPKKSAPPRVVSETVADGQSVSGVVDWRAHTLGPVARVVFLVDGSTLATQTREPWQVSWDATALSGTHVLEVRAYTRDGQVASRKATVTVSPPAAASTSPTP
ncbi:MAG TPA: N-acetylmuramoyl-L-alanine amidase [Gaiellaceae bacterium]